MIIINYILFIVMVTLFSNCQLFKVKMSTNTHFCTEILRTPIVVVSTLQYGDDNFLTFGFWISHNYDYTVHYFLSVNYSTFKCQRIIIQLTLILLTPILVLSTVQFEDDNLFTYNVTDLYIYILIYLYVYKHNSIYKFWK
jgi:hypothetical protein